VRVLVVSAVLVVAASRGWAGPPGLTPGPNASPYHAVPPLPGGEDLPAPLDALGAVTESPTPADRLDQPGFTASIAPDGTVRFDDRALGGGTGAATLAPFLSFDLSDVVMRAIGDDPYLARKLALLDATFDERMVRRARHDAATMRRALGELPRYLAAVWATRRWSPALRRRILFALWDEAAEDGNELVRRGGAEARATIEAFVARVLSPEHPHAFSAAELDELNLGRGSRARFAPYPAPPVLARPRPLAPARLARAL
jgi:hypothetical protein